ncbi:MAG: FHA domain-containing protein [Sedimentisphaerales bacterium]|nr:FHA domain-containing protein [Sedimentisphaerales bacterium]
MDISLVLLKKDGKKVFPVRSKATTLGRGTSCDLCIPLQVVSRKHCQLSQEENALKLRDLKSSNGTFLNGQKLDSEAELKAGDQFQIGPLTFAVQVDGKPDVSFLLPDTAVMQALPDISKADDDFLNGSGTFTGQ